MPIFCNFRRNVKIGGPIANIMAPIDKIPLPWPPQQNRALKQYKSEVSVSKENANLTKFNKTTKCKTDIMQI